MALVEADMGVTTMALGGTNSRYAADDQLFVKFETHPKRNSGKSKEAGRPIFEEVAYVSIMQPGNKDSIILRPATDLDKHRFAEHWRRFEAREDQNPEEGTLLDEWPGVTRSQCEELKFFNVRTVEQLANMSDSNTQNFMGIGYLKQKAQEYIKASDKNATVIALTDANTRIDQLMEMVEELQAAGLSVVDTSKPAQKKTVAKKVTRRKKAA